MNKTPDDHDDDVRKHSRIDEPARVPEPDPEPADDQADD